MFMNEFSIMPLGVVSENNRIYNMKGMPSTINGFHKIYSVCDTEDLRDFIYRDCGISVISINSFGILPPGKLSPPYQTIQCTLKECVSYINTYLKKDQCII